MSKISLAPDVAGTGIFTIASPGTNTNRTLTLPDDTGTIVTNSGNQAGSFTTLNTSGQVVFNDAGANVDFRVEGDTDANLLFVDASTDRVGVGTSSPIQKLHVAGKIAVSGTNPSIQQTVQNSSLDLCGGTTVGTDPSIQIVGSTTTSDSNTVFYNSNTHIFRSSTGGTNYAIINSSGNVGIGTSSPTEKLEVVGVARITNSIGLTAVAIVDTTVGGKQYSLISSGAGNAHGVAAGAFYVRDSTAGETRLLIDTAGNVGIGTSSPGGARLALAGAPGTFITMTDTTNTKTGFINYDNDNLIYFSNGPAERMRITSAGLVLTGGATSALINESAFGATSNANTATFKTTGGAGTNPLLVWNAAGSGTRELIALGTTSASFSQIGVISTDGSTITYGTGSDYRLKHDILLMTGALAKVALLKPVTYKWNLDDGEGQGFIAHELQAVCPDAVSGKKDATRIEQYEVNPAVYEDVVIPAVLDEDNNEVEQERIEKRLVSEAVMGEREVPVYQNVDTSFLVATLTAAIQELKAIVDAQAARIAALEGQ